MKFFLTILICSSVANTCIEPYTFVKPYDDSYQCLLDGYLKSYEKVKEIGKQEINQHGIFLKFECHQIIIPQPKPQIELGEPT